MSSAMPDVRAYQAPPRREESRPRRELWLRPAGAAVPWRWLAFRTCTLRASNDLPFSSERQGRVQAYHGREGPRAQPVASRHEPTAVRAHVAFDCCNGRLDGAVLELLVSPRALVGARHEVGTILLDDC